MANDTLKEARVAAFFDFENLALGLRQANYEKFRLDLVLDRLIEKGKVIFKRAYCDWSRYRAYKSAFHEANIELIDIPRKRISGKNSADIRMVVDALDLAHSHAHIDTFALLSGDSDFSPLVAKLSELDRHVIGVGVKNSSAEILVSVCDEFIYYDDIVRDARKTRQVVAPALAASAAASSGGSEPLTDLFNLMMGAIDALQREGHDVIWGSMVKQQIKRKKPSFSERAYGFRTFTAALEAAKKSRVIELQRDTKSGAYLVQDISAQQS